MHPKTSEIYVTRRYFPLTQEELRVWNNCQRIMRDQAPRGQKNTASVRDLVMKLMRIYEGQNMDVVRRLWAEDQLKYKPRKGFPRIVLPNK